MNIQESAVTDIRALRETADGRRTSIRIVPDSPSRQSRLQSRFLRLACAVAIYAVAVLARIYGISGPAPIPDELLWEKRVATFVAHAERGEWSQVSSHLRHPGVVPTALMAIAEPMRSAWHGLIGEPSDTPQQFDRLAAYRMANGIVSSLLPVVVFGLSSLFFGMLYGALTGLFVALDPQLIALGRVAHIDGILCVLVALTVAAYFLAAERGQLRWKMTAGICWGLALCTKPTAFLLVPAFLAWKMANRFPVARMKQVETEPVVAWSDIWAVLLGFIVVGGTYTRLWVHDDTSLGRLRVSSGVADSIFSSGLWLHQHAFVAGAAALALVCSSLLWFARWRLPGRLRFHLTNLSFLLGAVVSLITIAPITAENLIRYATFAFALSHESSNEWLNWKPAAWGYLEWLVRAIPSFVTIGVIASVGWLVETAMRHRRSPRAAYRLRALLLALIVTLVWAAGISLASKQSLRYALPIAPFLYILAVYGWAASAHFIGSRFGLGRQTAIAATTALLSVHAAATVHAYPRFHLAFSDISGGLKSARTHRLKFHFGGQESAISFLQDIAARDPFAPLTVAVRGADSGVFIEAAKRARSRHQPLLEFRHDLSPLLTDYVVLVGGFAEDIRELRTALDGATLPQPALVLEHDGVELLRVVELPRPSLRHPEIVSVETLARRAGRHRAYFGTKPARGNPEEFGSSLLLESAPGQDRKGYAFYGFRPRLSPGTYELRLALAIPSSAGNNPDNRPDQAVVRIDFGRCSRLVRRNELGSDAFRYITVTCDFDRPVRPQIRSYWFGKAAVLHG
ncbi:MAG: glycosyltransferase family 39 protein, partial [Bdellovibrionales bacterium]|nr:glycosyltransferase family 39 protein [Bdellovibrionales bacterium]